jgi:hypothetical protein
MRGASISGADYGVKYGILELRITAKMTVQPAGN